MIESREYRRFVNLVERVESHSSRRQLETLTFRRPGGGVAGVVTVDGGLVRFGVRCEGCDPIDECLQKDSSPLARALRRVIQGGAPLMAPEYAALRELTARSLRRIAEVCDPGAPADRSSDPAEAPRFLSEVAFTPSELMLAAGRIGAIDRNDPAVRLYGTPPGRAEERWLFEQQPGALGVPWPIMTTRLNGKGVRSIAAYGTLVQFLTASSLCRLGGDSLRPLVALLRLEQQLCLLRGTERYVTLLFYPPGHAKHVLSALAELIARARPAKASASVTIQERSGAPGGSDEAGTEPAPASTHGDPPELTLAPEPDRLSFAALPAPEAAAPVADPVLWEERASRSPAVLSLRGFRVSLGERCVLRDLSFDIGVNGAYLLLADEGGAKRLLVRALCGPRPATMQCSGSARYLGRQLVPGNAPATPQSGAALMMMSVCDYLISNLPDRDLLPRPAQRSRARTLLAKAGLPELEARFDEPLIQLDTRARRALEIVRTAAPRPALLILDEPLAGVEPAERPLLLELLRMQSRQRAVLLLAQHADLLLALAPKTGRLSNGEVRASALLPRETEQSTLPEIESDPTDRNNAADPGTEGPELAAAAMPGAEPT